MRQRIARLRDVLYKRLEIDTPADPGYNEVAALVENAQDQIQNEKTFTAWEAACQKVSSLGDLADLRAKLMN